MKFDRFPTAARLALAAGAALTITTTSLAAGDDDRPLPPAQNINVKIDDALTTIRGLAPAMKVVDSGIARHGDRWVHQFRLNRNSTVKMVKIDCSTGEVVVNRRLSLSGSKLSSIRQTTRFIDTLATTRQEAIDAAMASLPGGRVYEVELDDFNDQPVWKVKMLDGSRRVIVLVNAGSGVVIKQPTDGVADLSFDDIAARANQMFPGFETVEVELDDDRGFDDSLSKYEVEMSSTDGTREREVKFSASSGAVVRDRIKTVSQSNASRNAQIVAATPAIGFTTAGMAAADSRPGSFVHEVELKFEDGLLVYEVELFDADAASVEVYVDATTGLVVRTGSTIPGGGGTPGNPPGSPSNGSVTLDQAVAIALAAFPGLSVRETSQDVEDAGPVWEVKLISSGGARTDVQVLIATGQIVRVRER
ncbi:MAG: PepSY domain-containing protein [Phycisphaerales bacterium]|nr:PepSY domain-containing protein [Phycisphaerales bacterium]